MRRRDGFDKKPLRPTQALDTAIRHSSAAPHPISSLSAHSPGTHHHASQTSPPPHPNSYLVLVSMPSMHKKVSFSEPAGPSAGHATNGAPAAERVYAGEVLASYSGDIQSALMETVSRMETEETAQVTEDVRQELVQIVISYLETCEAIGDDNNAMRQNLADVNAEFGRIVSSSERGSPYRKLINLFNVKKSQRQRRARR